MYYTYLHWEPITYHNFETRQNIQNNPPGYPALSPCRPMMPLQILWPSATTAPISAVQLGPSPADQTLAKIDLPCGNLTV